MQLHEWNRKISPLILNISTKYIHIPHRKLKLYEEQELTMQVFSEPEISHIDTSPVIYYRNPF